DPNVSYGNASQALIDQFNQLIDSDPYLSGHRGTIAGRNESRGPWQNRIDLGIQQELPGFAKEHKSIVRLDVYNFLNLLNNDWGLTQDVGGLDARYLARLGGITADGKYIYDLGSEDNPTWQEMRTYEGAVPRPVSRWAVMLTLRYEF